MQNYEFVNVGAQWRMRIIFGNIQLMKKKDDKKDSKPKVDYLDLITRNLHDFKLACDYSGYQYTRLDLSSKALDALSTMFKQFKYIEHINLANNAIVDLSHLATLPNLVTLIADHNNVKDFKAFTVEEGWKALRVLNLSYNKVIELTSLATVPNLNQLYLTENKIEKVQGFGGHPKLRILELRRNKISNLQGLGNLEDLSELYLAENKIKSLTGLEIPKIKKLHLRKNIFSVFDETFPVYEQLTYLNLRENLIQKLEQIQKTKDLPNLREIVFSKNPLITKYEFYLLDIINANLKLRRVNKVIITKSIKLQAFKHAEKKWEEAKAQAKRKEEEERAKAEQEGAANPAEG